MIELRFIPLTVISACRRCIHLQSSRLGRFLTGMGHIHTRCSRRPFAGRPARHHGAGWNPRALLWPGAVIFPIHIPSPPTVSSICCCLTASSLRILKNVKYSEWTMCTVCMYVCMYICMYITIVIAVRKAPAPPPAPAAAKKIFFLILSTKRFFEILQKIFWI